VSPEHQRLAALELANDKRTRRAELRRRLAAERGALREVLMDPPPELEGVPIIDVVRLAYGSGRASKSIERLGRLAVRDRMNLLMPLGKASVRTREWTAEHAEWHWVPVGSSTRRQVVVS
jgi:hypothetical protein